MATCSDLNRHMEWELAPTPSSILQLHRHNHVIAEDFADSRKQWDRSILQLLHAGPMTGVIASFEKIVQLNLLMRDRSALCVTYLVQIKTHFNAFVHEHQYTIY